MSSGSCIFVLVNFQRQINSYVVLRVVGSLIQEFITRFKETIHGCSIVHDNLLIQFVFDQSTVKPAAYKDFFPGRLETDAFDQFAIAKIQIGF